MDIFHVGKIINEIAVELWTFIFGGKGVVKYTEAGELKSMNVNIPNSPLLQAAFILAIIAFACVLIYGLCRLLKLLNKKVLLGLLIGSMCLFICVGIMFTFANNELLKGTANVYQQTSSDPITFEEALKSVKENYIMNVGNGPVVISVFSFITVGVLGGVLFVDKFVKEK